MHLCHHGKGRISEPLNRKAETSLSGQRLYFWTGHAYDFSTAKPEEQTEISKKDYIIEWERN
jgi:hypothetical protein